MVIAELRQDRSESTPSSPPIKLIEASRIFSGGIIITETDSTGPVVSSVVDEFLIYECSEVRCIANTPEIYHY